MDIRKKARELDMRGIHSFDRHIKFLDAWGKLKEGESVRIKTDASPDLMKSQFETEHAGQFEWNYEKEGPDEWIFTVAKNTGAEKQETKKRIKELIRQIRTGEEDFGNITEEDRKKLAAVPPEDLAAAEQEMISEGVESKEVRSLCDVHIEFLKDKLGDAALKPGPGHPLEHLLSEHEIILKEIGRLEALSEKLEKAGEYSEVPGELEKLDRIVEHLVEFDRHHALEEEVIFPAVADTGITEPLEIVRNEHEELKKKKKQMQGVLKERSNLACPEFARRIKAFADYFSREYPDHICKEDNILFPIALRALSKEKWEELGSECERSGYCSFPPDS